MDKAQFVNWFQYHKNNGDMTTEQYLKAILTDGSYAEQILNFLSEKDLFVTADVIWAASKIKTVLPDKSVVFCVINAMLALKQEE